MVKCKTRVVRAQQKRQAGITLLEVVIVLIIFSVLLGTILESIYYYQGKAEQAAVQRLVVNMRTALNGRRYEAMVAGRKLDYQALARENPMTWLQSLPENYCGEISNSTKEALAPGCWYFDALEHKLVYMFSSKKSFLGDSFERWYFKVEFNRLPANTAKQVEPSQAEPGVTLVQVDSG
jgi:type II secretory pathway pseudopilin PulG